MIHILHKRVRLREHRPNQQRLCTNRTRMKRFQHIRVIFGRKADSPICWKRQQLEVMEGAVGVGVGAPKALGIYGTVGASGRYRNIDASNITNLNCSVDSSNRLPRVQECQGGRILLMKMLFSVG
jgi:hypothetical protein